MRLGVDVAQSGAWDQVRERFDGARYRGVAGDAFTRWWMEDVLSQWTALCPSGLFKLTAGERVTVLREAGHGDLMALEPTSESPGNRPWVLGQSEDPALRLPADPRFTFAISTPVAPWLDVVKAMGNGVK